jgi:hypothetical protein
VTSAGFAEHVAWLARRATEILVEDGELLPSVFLVAPPGVTLTVPAMVVVPNGATAVVRRMVRAQGCAGTVTVLTVWRAPASAAEWGLRPSADPERREALCVSWEYHEGDNRSEGCAFQYFRREGGRIVLEERRVEATALVAGPFAPFLS